ncbi:MAG: hypothetical protein ACTHOK_13090 [Nocardioidaceae bacterium]
MYEVNTCVWLGELGASSGQRVGLADVPATAWDALALPGVDAVWLMGVWERSAEGLRIARADEGLLRSWREALPDLEEDDVLGSPYCIRRYVVDPRLGGREALAVARTELARRGVRLLLDYVPNHVAPDHPWVTERPELFVTGTPDDVHQTPEAFLDAGGRVLARGRDPYFPPWPDVVQLNAFDAGLREATVDVLTDIGEQCDGVRCDMAILLMNDVFAKTWGDRVGPPPAEEFWPHVLGRVREHHPDMLFVAEAYWDLEWALQQQGFDFCYDKRLYDRFTGEEATTAADVGAHLAGDAAYQRRLVRFLENHDEPRAAAMLSPQERERAAAVSIATLPGLTLWHEGEFEGRRTRPPVFLARRPDEPTDAGLRDFHLDLVDAVADSRMRTGRWTLLRCTGWPDNPSFRNLTGWIWEEGAQRHLVIVNLSPWPAQARVPLPWADLAGRSWELVPLVTAGDSYHRDGDELVDPGLFVDLPPWGWHVLAVREGRPAIP